VQEAWRLVISVIFTRGLLNTGYRAPYPFLPLISRGLGISVTAASFLITIRSVVGLLAPAFGPLSDRFGRRMMMMAAVLLFILGASLCGLVSSYLAFMVGFCLISLSKVTFDPALQAYLGDRFPYQVRGRVMGFTELAWSFATVIGLPVIGWLMERTNWQTPFLALGLTGLVGMAVLAQGVPSASATAKDPDVRPVQIWRTLSQTRSVWKALGVMFLIVFANELVILIYGAWLERQFGLGAAALGLATMAIGAGELLGEFGSGVWVDRVGKKRAVVGGAALSAVCYVLLPYTGYHLTMALVGLFCTILTFEWSLVCYLPFMTEVAPEARGTVMTLNVSVMSLGRAAGSLLSGLLWAQGSYHVIGWVAGIGALSAATILQHYVREGGQSALELP